MKMFTYPFNLRCDFISYSYAFIQCRYFKCTEYQQLSAKFKRFCSNSGISLSVKFGDYTITKKRSTKINDLKFMFLFRFCECIIMNNLQFINKITKFRNQNSFKFQTLFQKAYKSKDLGKSI